MPRCWSQSYCVQYALVAGLLLRQVRQEHCLGWQSSPESGQKHCLADGNSIAQFNSDMLWKWSGEAEGVNIKVYAVAVSFIPYYKHFSITSGTHKWEGSHPRLWYEMRDDIISLFMKQYLFVGLKIYLDSLSFHSYSSTPMLFKLFNYLHWWRSEPSSIARITGQLFYCPPVWESTAILSADGTSYWLFKIFCDVFTKKSPCMLESRPGFDKIQAGSEMRPVHIV